MSYKLQLCNYELWVDYNMLTVRSSYRTGVVLSHDPTVPQQDASQW